MRPIGSTHTGQPGPWIMLHVGGQQVLQAVARDRVGVAAAELHQVYVRSARASRAIARRELRASPPSRNSSMYFMTRHQRAASGPLRRTCASVRAASVRVELGQRVADVDDHVVADRDVVDQRERDLLAHAAEIDAARCRARAARRRGREWRGTWSGSAVRGASQRDPRLAEARGRRRWAAPPAPRAARGRARRARARKPRARIALRKQPPPPATVVDAGAVAARATQSASAATSVAWNSAAPKPASRSAARRAISGVRSSSFPAGSRRATCRRPPDRALGESFEQHRRLAFERHPPPDAEQSGRGVEPAAHAARRRRVEAARQHRVDGARRGLVGKAPRRFRRRGRSAPAPPPPCARARARRGRRRAGAAAQGGRGARNAAPSTRSSSPPHAAPSAPRPTPSSASPSTGPSIACSASTAATCA